MKMIHNTYSNHPLINKIIYLLIYIILLFVVIISVVPLIWIFISTFKTNIEVLDNALTWPGKFTFNAYFAAFDLSKIHLCLGNSLIISISSTTLSLFIYSMAAYVVARFKFKGKTLISILLVSSLLIPGNSMIQSIYNLAVRFGLYDTKFVLVIVYTGFGMALTIFILKSYFADLPKDLEEAAYIEGSGVFTTYFKIMFPLAKPALASAGTLLFINNWNEFLYALLLTSSTSNRTVPVALKAFKSFFTYNYPAMFAAIVMAVIPCIIIYIILQEQIMESMVAGAVKG